MSDMIEDVSNSIIPPPLSLTDCLFDGQIDPIRYLFYQCRYPDLSYSQNMCAAITKKRKSAVPILSIYKKTEKISETTQVISSRGRWYIERVALKRYVMVSPLRKYSSSK